MEQVDEETSEVDLPQKYNSFKASDQFTYLSIGIKGDIDEELEAFPSSYEKDLQYET